MTWPEVGRSSPAAQCSSVVLPDPEAPITAVQEPGGNTRLTSRNAVTALRPVRYTLVTPRSATAAPGSRPGWAAGTARAGLSAPDTIRPPW